MAKITDPIALVGKQNDYDITILAKGGGVTGQVDAARLAIAKALSSINDDLRATLSKAGYLRRDSREVANFYSPSRAEGLLVLHATIVS